MKVLGRLISVKLLLIFFLIGGCPGLAGAKVLVGVLMTADIPYYQMMHEAFIEEIQNKLPAGEKIDFILQRPFPDPIAWSNAARKLIALDVDLIVSYGSPATNAVLFEKSNIPVVFAGIYAPEEIQYPGDKLTGCGYRIPLSSLLRYFKRIKNIGRLHVIYCSAEEDSVRQLEELVQLGKQQDIQISGIDIRSHNDLRKLMGTSSEDAVYMTGSSVAHIWLEDILVLLRERQVPAVDIFPDVKEQGMLITLYHPPSQQGEMAAEIASRVIGGEEIGTITPEVLRETELVFNIAEAKKLGISFPIQLIVESTRVIR